MADATARLAEAARELFGLVESGMLVRDISHDNEVGWSLGAVRVVSVLGELREALAAYDARQASIEPVETLIHNWATGGCSTSVLIEDLRHLFNREQSQRGGDAAQRRQRLADLLLEWYQARYEGRNIGKFLDQVEALYGEQAHPPAPGPEPDVPLGFDGYCAVHKRVGRCGQRWDDPCAITDAPAVAQEPPKPMSIARLEELKREYATELYEPVTWTLIWELLDAIVPKEAATPREAAPERSPKERSRKR